jgi:hypothetical protein
MNSSNKSGSPSSTNEKEIEAVKSGVKDLNIKEEEKE